MPPLETPLGPLCIIAKAQRITAVRFSEDCTESADVPEDAVSQIKEYFAGERTHFEIPLDPKGTEYQRRVWKAAEEIPYGETRTYEWIADKAGGSPRSAGNALHRNPIPIIIPCHRVIRKDGSIGGYSGGAEIKRFLLEHERRVSAERTHGTPL